MTALIGFEKQWAATVTYGIVNIFAAKNIIMILNFHFNPTIWPQAEINVVKKPLHTLLCIMTTDSFLYTVITLDESLM